MAKTLTAVFDGKVLRPDGETDLEPNARYLVIVERVVPRSEEGDAWAVLESLIGSIDAPEDWSAEHDHYLYGTEKRGDQDITPADQGNALDERDGE